MGWERDWDWGLKWQWDLKWDWKWDRGRNETGTGAGA